jgi:hypothetical protein
MIQRSYDKIISFQIFLVFAIVVIALLAAIATDGARRGQTSVFPDLYRNFSSLAVAISELDYGTTGLVGLRDVDDTLKQGGMIPNAPVGPLLKMVHEPAKFDALLLKAAHLQHVDRARTMIVEANETGSVEYYKLAMILFGHHVTGFYWLWFGIVSFVSLCFLVTFRHRPVLIFPAIIYLVALFAFVHHLDPNDLQKGTPTNARLFPFTSLYLVLFSLVLSAAAPARRWLGVISIAVCGLLYAMFVNARSVALWQFGAPVGVLIMAIMVHVFSGLQRVWGGIILARYALWPLVVFSLATGAGIATHHLRENRAAYSHMSFMGHEFWSVILYPEMKYYRSDIPKIEKETGMTIGENPDAFVEAMTRLEIMKRHERFSDYLIDGGYWNIQKWNSLCRQIVFDHWREHPMRMLKD